MCKPLITTPLTAASPVTFTDFALDCEKKWREKYENDFRSCSHQHHHRTIKLLNKDENEIFKNFQQNYNFSRNSALLRFAVTNQNCELLHYCQYPGKS